MNNVRQKQWTLCLLGMGTFPGKGAGVTLTKGHVVSFIIVYSLQNYCMCS